MTKKRFLEKTKRYFITDKMKMHAILHPYSYSFDYV